MGELNLRPIRLRGVGTGWLYPTYIKSSVFSTHIVTDLDQNDLRRNLFNIGAQLDVQLVLFSYMKTTWSVGYARFMENDAKGKNQLMLSLKLLGN
jgi:hypothetical protein